MARLADTSRRVKHPITHRAIEVEVGGDRRGDRARRAALRWTDPASRELALTALAKKVVAPAKGRA